MSAIGTRIEIERVAFRLACSISRSSTFGSVFPIFDPVERTSVPSLSARANSRCVCRRPCGVAYQPASSVSDLNPGTSGDLRGGTTSVYTTNVYTVRIEELFGDGPHDPAKDPWTP